MSNLSSVTSECSSSSSLPLQQFDDSTTYDRYCNSSSVPKLQPMYHFLSVVFGFALPVILIGLVVLMYVMYTRRQTRRELEGGECNLPTVVWKPRFMNYTAQDDNADGDDDINWDDEDCVMEWARNFLKDNSTTATETADGIKLPPIKKKKMSSSAITNILPRMERLGGPYGLYATVYGIQTKVIHVAHPIPARAILTGAGVVEINSLGNGTGSSDTTGSFSFSHRKSLRMLSGSTKYPAYDHFKNFSGDGVFTANGTDWKAKRASVMHCLLRNGGALESLEAEANRTADSFEREVTYVMKSSSSKSPVMDVVPMLQRSTIALIYRLISHHNVEFGPKFTGKHREKVGSTTSGKVSPLPTLSESCDDDDNDESEIADCSSDSKNKEDEIKELLPIYLDSVTRIRMIVLAQSRSFWYLLPRWVYKTFSPMYRDEERTMVPIRKFARLVCENAVPGSPLALLSERDSHSSGNPTGSNVSKDLLDEAITLLFAGQDTSAATLSWTLHLLSLHPDKQERVAKEVRSVLANAETKPILKSHISKMPYLDAVIKESMRLYPVAPFIVRKLTSDIAIPIDEGDLATPNQMDSNKTCSMPASTFACIWIYALHHNPKLWQRPNDFLPERWIDPELRDQDVGQKEYGAYMPFAIGPRNCLGQPLAQVVLRILLARIINRYLVVDPKYQALQKLTSTVENDDKFDPKYLRKDMQAGFTVLPSNGLKVQLVERL